ncbi:MAG: hypothetical protein ABR521_01055 [Gaiellaceae bacterium]
MALAFSPVTDAKRANVVVIVGVDGRSFQAPISLVEPSASPPPAQLRGGFLLAYPLIEGGLPARPARVYAAVGALCSSWNTLQTPQPRSCLRLSEKAVRRFSQVNLDRFQAAPSLRRIAAVRALSAPDNYLTGIELAFHRWRSARFSTRPDRCVRVTALWRPASRRPTSFCLSKKGAWAAGRLYPYPRAVCRAADFVGPVSPPALPECL